MLSFVLLLGNFVGIIQRLHCVIVQIVIHSIFLQDEQIIFFLHSCCQTVLARSVLTLCWCSHCVQSQLMSLSFDVVLYGIRLQYVGFSQSYIIVNAETAVFVFNSMAGCYVVCWHLSANTMIEIVFNQYVYKDMNARSHIKWIHQL